ncbi:hypothetical protein F5J12DRAFT_722550, partial [Pisolithus orientalis]|uniref:uncharacterized protein n=1 Tax=Pisolithus orientalis TaxID=936130 RepID=UPI00222520AF
HPTPEPALEPYDKSGRGFYHDTTAWLICPVDYNWSIAQHRANIHGFHPNFHLTADSWPHFLYKNEEYNPKNPVKGLFKNSLLLQLTLLTLFTIDFLHIFTSPSSAASKSAIHNIDEESQHTTEPMRKRQRGPSEKCTCAHITALLRMKSVSPHAIAYAAVQLQYALSSASSWHIIDKDFNYELFYHNIVSFFEDVHNVVEKAKIDELLLWWNQ